MRARCLPEFNRLGSDQSGSFERELAFGEIDWKRVQEAEGDVAILSNLRIAADLQWMSQRTATNQGEPLAPPTGRGAGWDSTHLDVEFGLLQLEVVLFAPRLLGLLHGGQGVDLDHAVVDDLVAVFLPAHAHLQSLPYKQSPRI